MSNRADKATKIFSVNCNCAQSTLVAFSDLTGLDDLPAYRLSSSLGGGIGGMKGICGALTGSMLAAGLIKGYGYAPANEDKKAHNALIANLAKKFEAEFGSVDCGPLLDKNEADGLPKESRPCTRYVRYAVESLEEEL